MFATNLKLMNTALQITLPQLLLNAFIHMYIHTYMFTYVLLLILLFEKILCQMSGISINALTTFCMHITVCMHITPAPTTAPAAWDQHGVQYHPTTPHCLLSLNYSICHIGKLVLRTLCQQAQAHQPTEALADAAVSQSTIQRSHESVKLRYTLHWQHPLWLMMQWKCN